MSSIEHTEKTIFVPTEIFGEIICFFSTPKELFKIYTLAKRFQWYIENEDSKCCRNISFKPNPLNWKSEFRDTYSYVYSLYCKYDGKNKDNLDELLKTSRFPNLRALGIKNFGLANVDCQLDFLQGTPFLESVSFKFEAKERIVVDYDIFQSSKFLKHVTLENFDFSNIRVDELTFWRNLETFQLHNCKVPKPLKSDSNLSFPNLKKLDLGIGHESELSTLPSFLRNSPNLGGLELHYYEEIKGIKKEEFFLPELRKLSIVNVAQEEKPFKIKTNDNQLKIFRYWGVFSAENCDVFKIIKNNCRSLEHLCYQIIGRNGDQEENVFEDQISQLKFSALKRLDIDNYIKSNGRFLENMKNLQRLDFKATKSFKFSYLRELKLLSNLIIKIDDEVDYSNFCSESNYNGEILYDLENLKEFSFYGVSDMVINGGNIDQIICRDVLKRGNLKKLVISMVFELSEYYAQLIKSLESFKIRNESTYGSIEMFHRTCNLLGENHLKESVFSLEIRKEDGSRASPYIFSNLLDLSFKEKRLTIFLKSVLEDSSNNLYQEEESMLRKFVNFFCFIKNLRISGFNRERLADRFIFGGFDKKESKIRIVDIDLSSYFNLEEFEINRFDFKTFNLIPPKKCSVFRNNNPMNLSNEVVEKLKNLKNEE